MEFGLALHLFCLQDLLDHLHVLTSASAVPAAGLLSVTAPLGGGYFVPSCLFTHPHGTEARSAAEFEFEKWRFRCRWDTDGGSIAGRRRAASMGLTGSRREGSRSARHGMAVEVERTTSSLVPTRRGIAAPLPVANAAPLPLASQPRNILSRPFMWLVS